MDSKRFGHTKYSVEFVTYWAVWTDMASSHSSVACSALPMKCGGLALKRWGRDVRDATLSSRVAGLVSGGQSKVPTLSTRDYQPAATV